MEKPSNPTIPTSVIGIVLIGGGIILALVATYLVQLFYSEGQLTAVSAAIIMLLSLGLLAIPQILLGIYFWRQTQ